MGEVKAPRQNAKSGRIKGQNDVQFGFKRLALSNWLEPDDASVCQVHSADEWFSAVSSPRLTTEVPEPIHALVEVVRGTLLYGYLFYPLMTVATDQGFRVLESAVRLKCESLGIATERVRNSGQLVPATYRHLLDKLVSRRIVDVSDEPQWQIAQQLRNMASHPTRQSIVNPGIALSMFSITVTQINKLFAGMQNQ